jgi:hypothetical protein
MYPDPMRQTRFGFSAFSALLLAGVLMAAVEGSAGSLRWTVPGRWQVAAARPMRAATYTIPAAAGAEAGECGVFYFGKGQGGSVDENLDRWTKQFEATGAPKRSQRTIAGMKVHLLDVSGAYLAPSGPMMQSADKKTGWRLSGAIVEAPDGLVFFKCVGPAATMQKAQADIDELLKSLVKVGGTRA